MPILLHRLPRWTGSTRPSSWALVSLVFCAFCLASPSIAAPAPEPASHGTASHGDDAHGDDAHGDDAHGEHHYYSADDDMDGTPNWRDPMNGDAPNTETYVRGKLLWHGFNLALLIGLVLVFVRRPVADALRTRALDIRKDLTDSARARDEAQQRHSEIAARLVAIESEIQTLRDEAIAEAAILEAKLIERAHDEARRIADGAERKIRDEAQRARTDLRRDAVELAVELAERTLRTKIDAEDQQRLAREFLTAIHDDGANANV
jgi:F-type H+-transporting ATPase subunit b